MDKEYTQKFKISLIDSFSYETKEEEILFISSKTHGQYLLSNITRLNGFRNNIISSKYGENYRHSWQVSNFFKQRNLKFPIDIEHLRFELLEILKQSDDYFHGITLFEPTDIKISKEDYIKKGYKFKT